MLGRSMARPSTPLERPVTYALVFSHPLAVSPFHELIRIRMLAVTYNFDTKDEIRLSFLHYPRFFSSLISTMFGAKRKKLKPEEDRRRCNYVTIQGRCNQGKVTLSKDGVRFPSPYCRYHCCKKVDGAACQDMRINAKGFCQRRRPSPSSS